jgi:hypothetical protein
MNIYFNFPQEFSQFNAFLLEKTQVVSLSHSTENFPLENSLKLQLHELRSIRVLLHRNYSSTSKVFPPTSLLNRKLRENLKKNQGNLEFHDAVKDENLNSPPTSRFFVRLCVGVEKLFRVRLHQTARKCAGNFSLSRVFA